ncbi:MAG TPA: NAD(P)/FAD-dependent oxidoreductase [Tepidisphaeraceae bacterium]|nr:NAD(P)/FAD-dependent oxidoreductase [Tepidisphaeraceae bacterium]
MAPAPDFDVIIIGGGPAGATSAIRLARAGMRVLVLERATFPRFHLGESLLPRNFPLMQELGLEEKLRKLPHVPKFGVEFAMGDGSAYARFRFDQALIPAPETVNLERAPFDQMLLDTAREAGADVRENTAVKKIVKLKDGDVRVEADGRDISGRVLLDCSGQGTVVGRHLGTRQAATDPHLQKVAYFAAFENVERAAGREGGDPLIVMCEEGWFWVIPLDEKRTSVGLVMDPNVARSLDVPANRILAWGIERCPAVRKRMERASGLETNQVTADFSYTCKPYAGPGYFLVGDAAAFMDPIFSTGVTLAMTAANEVSKQVLAILQDRTTPAAARKAYLRFVQDSTGIFFRFIRQYYDHSFRELFLNGTGPLRVHSAVLSILAGEVFPRPIFALRWRLQLFYFLQWLNRHRALVPRRNRFSLLSVKPMESLVAARE